ncbi:MAG: HEAT repeat domain-containing protein [Planctomycetota bacterium]
MRGRAQAGYAYSPSPAAAPDLGPSPALVHGTIVPALRALLDEKRLDDEVRSSALLALARIGEPDDSSLGSSELAELFAQHLGSHHRGVTENACIALGVLGHPSSVPILAAVLGDTERGRKLSRHREVPDHLRAYAAYGLGLTGQYAGKVDVRRFAVQSLLAALDERVAKPDLRVAAVIALGMVPPGAGGDSATSSNDVLVERLLELFEDDREHDQVRAHAATSLAWLFEGGSAGSREAVAKSLLSALDERSNEPNAVRQSAALALGRVGDADEDALDGRIRAALVKASGKGDETARRYALIALGRIAGREGDGRGDPLAGVGEVRKALLRSLAKGKASLRPWAALALGVLGHEARADGRPLPGSDLAALRSALDDAKVADTSAALQLGVALCGDAQAEEALLDELAEGSLAQRAFTSLALGVLGAKEAVEPLHEVLWESKHDPHAMKEATIALKLLGDAQLVPELIAIAGSCQCTLSQTVVATAMGHTGDARVVPTLLAMLDDEKAQSRKRAWAAYALGLVADKEPQPWTSRISIDLNYRANPTSLTAGNGAGILDFP